MRSSSMCSNYRTLSWTLMLPLLFGVSGSQWHVTQNNVCAVKGSSVVLRCSFHHPDDEIVQEVMWGRNISDDTLGPFALYNGSDDPYSKFHYVGNKVSTCSLAINQVEHIDTGVYKFRFITKSEKGKWTGKEGSALKVVDLKTVGTHTHQHGAIMEGDMVNLTCVNSCDSDPISSAFTWFNNNQPVHEGPSLYWSNVSSSHSGNYTCSLKAHKNTTSEVISINVEYGPKTTSVSVQPSMADYVSGNVTLTCSSYANPQVEKYLWFKIHDADDDIIPIGNESELLLSGIYNATQGRYFCSATNRHGSKNSTVVTLKVKEPFPYTTCIITAAAISALLIMVTVVVALRGINKKRRGAAEADHEEDPQNTVYNTRPRSDNSNEGNRCVGEKLEEIYTTIDFSKKRESNTRQHMDSPDGDVIYSMISAWSEP